MIETLNVFMKGVLVGHLFWDHKHLSFSYTNEYRSDPTSAQLSLSLPLSHDLFPESDVEAYFSGLLPDENLRRRLARHLHVSDANTFGLLKEMGAECAGAVSILPDGMKPNNPLKPSFKALSEEESYELLMSLKKNPLGVDAYGNYRISGAGAQDKLMVCLFDSDIYLPQNGTPSTHIIKTNIEGLQDTCQNEYFCMELAQMIGLEAPAVRLLSLKDKVFYAVERYDRIYDSNNHLVRLHQEDLCQAMGYNPKIKYENEKGPGLLECQKCIKSNSAIAGRDMVRFVRIILYNFLIGNGDAHGKNFSLLYHQNNVFLAPFYDLMSSGACFDYTRKEAMAMKIDGTYLFSKVFMPKLNRLSTEMGFREDFIQNQFQVFFKNIVPFAKSLRDELNANPVTRSKVYDKIVRIIERHFEQLL
ncbi:MAG: type II toxin-antitoxin system HipA family toxin [Lactobacillales bacterium]|jgi:serine/threonine-protein kinase HipA|nr:type II toxin-antitoxin system HipA family toxin [Lactobacillales bacterium]